MTLAIPGGIVPALGFKMIIKRSACQALCQI